MIDYLRDAQQAQGQYLPLWFGHQHSPDRANPTYGTGRVLTALCDLLEGHPAAVGPMATRSAGWLLAAQRADGGWGGNATVEPSIEETAVAVEALARATSAGEEGKLDVHTAPLRSAVRRGVGWLVTHTDRGRAFPSAPIGLYFARLWYSEALYPVIFTVSALRSARHFVASR
jgi:squalene-hopene/tetraprenyl-beta-curcumene cyclase